MQMPPMNLFSELYNCYYQVTAEILRKASQSPLTRQQICAIAETEGYQESALEIVPRLLEGDWALLSDCGDGRYQSRLGREPFTPFTALQKSWLKALLKDERVALFFSDGQLKELEAALAGVEPLFDPSDFLYFDRYRDSDPVGSVMYRQHFSTILRAIRWQQPLRIVYYSGKNRTMEHTWLPSRMEYSPKDGKFRLCAFYRRADGRWRLDVLNVARILRVEAGKTGKAGKAAPASADIHRKQKDPGSPRQAPEPVACIGSPRQISGSTACTGSAYHNPEAGSPFTPDIDTWLEASLSRKPLVLEITDDRNALERTMLHFACYQKTVERTEDPHRYRCSIYYDVRWETELLIQVLSFGPMVKVLGPEHFLNQIKERVMRQGQPEMSCRGADA